MHPDVLSSEDGFENSQDSRDKTDNSVKTPSKNAYKYICDVCNKSYSSKYSLNTHKVKHLGLKVFRCLDESCPKTFSEKGNRNQHYRLVHLVSLSDLTLQKLRSKCKPKFDIKHHKNNKIGKSHTDCNKNDISI